MNMRCFFVGAAVGAVLLAGTANAAPSQGRGAIRPPAPHADLQLAQVREIEIYFDGQGNRVIVDSYTGQVIAVEPPRRIERRARREARRSERFRQREERYYLNNPNDMARYRRDRGLTEEEEFGQAAREPFLAPEVFPEAPPKPKKKKTRKATKPVEQETAAVEPVERKPLPVERKPLPAKRKALPDGRSVEQAAREAEAIESETDTAARQTDTAANQTDSATDAEAPVVASTEPLAPDAAPAIEPPSNSAARVEVAELQILLDRTGASPGVIDGRFGSNVDKALAAYRLLTASNLKSTDAAAIKAALAETGGDAFIDYEITQEDAAGPFVASVPADYGDKAKLERLSYTSVSEMLGEKFHMDEDYLKALNPEANFGRPGTIIKVANVSEPATKKVARIVADKRAKQVRAFDASDNLVAAYPATIGSEDTPSPSGTHTVARIALDPEYTYNPKINFKQGENEEILTIPPGPNGPVGSVWIALSKPTYGIHGTPDPSKIGKTESHGCVRLTNWDARELAKLVSEGVMVEFAE